MTSENNHASEFLGWIADDERTRPLHYEAARAILLGEQLTDEQAIAADELVELRYFTKNGDSYVALAGDPRVWRR